MNRLAVRRVALCAACLTLVTIVAAAVPSYSAPTEPDFKAMSRKVFDAWQTLDPAKVAPYFSQAPDAQFYDMAPLKFTGWKEYAAATGEMFKQWNSLTLTMNDDFWVQKHGDLAVTGSTGRAESVGKDGTKWTVEWRWTAVWEKKAGAWLISHEHLSTPLSLPEPAGEGQ